MRTPITCSLLFVLGLSLTSTSALAASSSSRSSSQAAPISSKGSSSKKMRTASSKKSAAGSVASFPISNNWWTAWGFFGKDSLNNTSVHLDEKPSFIRAELPKGSFWGLDVQQPKGGFSGVATGGFIPSETIYLSYDIRFPTDFSFGRGGFLPCIYGGRTATKINFSCALAWDKNGKFALYTTFPNMANADVYVSTTSTPLPIDGQWHTITIEGSMNSPTKGNGTLKVSLDGESVLSTSKAMYRTKETDKFEGISFDAFYRGRNAATQDAAPADTYIDFANISLKSKK